MTAPLALRRRCAAGGARDDDRGVALLSIGRARLLAGGGAAVARPGDVRRRDGTPTCRARSPGRAPRGRRGDRAARRRRERQRRRRSRCSSTGASGGSAPGCGGGRRTSRGWRPRPSSTRPARGRGRAGADRPRAARRRRRTRSALWRSRPRRCGTGSGPSAEREASDLEGVERAARDALAEMRRLLGVLRSPARTRRSRRSPGSASSSASSPTRGRPGSAVDLTWRASRAALRPASTSRRTGSSRRR